MADTVVRAHDLREYFHQALHAAAQAQRLRAEAATLWYLTDLLVRFSRSERFYDYTESGWRLRPLAELYGIALEAEQESERRRILQRMGDVALFVAGLFAGQLGRRGIDVDYYIAMGGTAYGVLSEMNAESVRDSALSCVFEDLAGRFVGFADVLAEIGEQRCERSDEQLLRLYELWQKTGSERLARKLRGHGIDPLPTTGRMQ
ncbi:MAG: hypothetical protein KDG50_00515 [Chromatiales bacterium]|nr:hypothetical protein [Chromatiales bacterium]